MGEVEDVDVGEEEVKKEEVEETVKKRKRCSRTRSWRRRRKRRDWEVEDLKLGLSCLHWEEQQEQ